MRDRGARIVVALIVAFATSACGLESDGSRRASVAETPGSNPGELGRYRTEAIRLGVQRPLFLLIDTATGAVEQRVILSNQEFKPVGASPAPGAGLETLVPGRFDVQVVPGRRGSGLLRLDTVTGRVWFLQLGPEHPEWKEIARASVREAAQAAKALDAAGANAAQNESEGASASGTQNTTPGPTGVGASGRPVQRKIELRALKEVLLDPSQDIQLRVWTAKQAAELYPAETAELTLDALSGDDPKILVAIANTAQLDPEGRVRAAFEQLASHDDEAVQEAVAERIGGPPQ